MSNVVLREFLRRRSKPPAQKRGVRRRPSASHAGPELSRGCDDPALAFYPGAHRLVRPPETVLSRSGHVSYGTFSVSVVMRPGTFRARSA